MYTKRRFKGNQYKKSVNTNDKTLSNEHGDNFVSASNKKIKLSTSHVVNLTNINNNSPATAVTTDTEMSKTTMTANTFMSDSSFLLIDASILKDIINCRFLNLPEHPDATAVSEWHTEQHCWCIR